MYSYLINIEELTLMSAYHWVCPFIKMITWYLFVGDKRYLVPFNVNCKYLPTPEKTLKREYCWSHSCFSKS